MQNNASVVGQSSGVPCNLGALRIAWSLYGAPVPCVCWHLSGRHELRWPNDTGRVSGYEYGVSVRSSYSCAGLWIRCARERWRVVELPQTRGDRIPCETGIPLLPRPWSAVGPQRLYPPGVRGSGSLRGRHHGHSTVTQCLGRAAIRCGMPGHAGPEEGWADVANAWSHLMSDDSRGWGTPDGFIGRRRRWSSSGWPPQTYHLLPWALPPSFGDLALPISPTTWPDGPARRY